MSVFLRDGFIDRYTGERLLFPGTLRLLNRLLPEDFPCDDKARLSVTHQAFWELFPSLDHIVPVSRGGPDTEDNWVTTSMSRNAAKGLWTLEELGWRLLPPGDSQWDGLTGWCMEHVRTRPTLLKDDAYLRSWYTAAVRVGVERHGLD